MGQNCKIVETGPQFLLFLQNFRVPVKTLRALNKPLEPQKSKLVKWAKNAKIVETGTQFLLFF